jgi:hypothetical protein
MIVFSSLSPWERERLPLSSFDIICDRVDDALKDFNMLSVRQFLSMRSPLRALVFLFWVYEFVSQTVGVFTQIYVYRLFNSVSLNIIATMVTFTGIMIGFCVYGAAVARYQLNAKFGFLLSFVFTGAGLILLSMAHDAPRACIAMGVRGVGVGLFWLTIHTYELVETRDNERDVYSTFLSAGGQMISLAGPAFATLLIWASQELGWNEFTLLFVATPPIYVLGFLFFGALTDYRPAPIQRHDLAHFVTDRRNQAAQMYLMGGAARLILEHIVLPLASITVLGTALHVGGFNTGFAIVGAVALLMVGAYRHPKNRLLILGVCSIILLLLNVMLGLSLTIITLSAYSVGKSVVQPIMRVSQHVIDLQTMNSVGHDKSDFYPTMILRDFSLWVWRMIAALMLLAAAPFAGTGREAISVGLYFVGATIVITYIGARLLLALQPDAEASLAHRA